ncbi:MAG: hypothetical protein RMJ88_06400 [Thermogemmata sp.]|nr:hypothetical protein [Thermogemmata sp.]
MSEATPTALGQGSRRTILWLTALGSVLGIIIVVLVFGAWGQSAAEKIAERHLKKAEERSQQAIDQQLQHLNRFFKHAKDGVPDFAAAALGFYSKFRLIWDHMPFTDRDGHKKFLQSKFEEHVFSRQQLEQCIEQVIHLYLQEIRSIENKMLVDLQADLADLSSESPLTQYNHQQLWQKFEQEMLNQIRKSTSTHLKLDLTREVVSVIAAEALSKVVTRLGVSAGILGFGATSGWATLESDW